MFRYPFPIKARNEPWTRVEKNPLATLGFFPPKNFSPSRLRKPTLVTIYHPRPIARNPKLMRSTIWTLNSGPFGGGGRGLCNGRYSPARYSLSLDNSYSSAFRICRGKKKKVAGYLERFLLTCCLSSERVRCHRINQAHHLFLHCITLQVCPWGDGRGSLCC